MVSKLKNECNTFFDERTGELLVNLGKTNPQYRALRLKTKEQTDKLKQKLSESDWTETKDLLKSLQLLSDVEQQYLFSQGLIDCAIIHAYLQGEILERNFVDKGNGDA